MFAAGGIGAVALGGAELDELWSGEFSEQSETNIFRPRQQLEFEEGLALVRG